MEKTDKYKAFCFSSTHNEIQQKSYFDNLKIRKINNNGSFSKTKVPLFLKKKTTLKVKDSIRLEKEKMSKLCRISSNSFSNIISDFRMRDLMNYGLRSLNTNSAPGSIEIKIFVQHLSIINLKKKKLDSVTTKQGSNWKSNYQ